MIEEAGQTGNIELFQVAVSVSEDLWSFIGGEDTEMELHQNKIVVTVTKKALEITCIGPESFRLMGDIIGAQLYKDNQKQVHAEPRGSTNDAGTISKSEVVRIVTAWVRERREEDKTWQCGRRIRPEPRPLYTCGRPWSTGKVSLL
jgi:hypothetical protein